VIPAKLKVASSSFFLPHLRKKQNYGIQKIHKAPTGYYTCFACAAYIVPVVGPSNADIMGYGRTLHLLRAKPHRA
jgi:hypothetical protein